MCHGQYHASGGDSVIGYQLYYQHVNTVTTINITSHDHTAVFTEGNERVYSVSIHSLSEHLPSDLVGPIIARGTSDNNACIVMSYLSVMVYYSSYLSTKCTDLSCDGEKTEYIMGNTKVPKFKHTELYHIDYRSK